MLVHFFVSELLCDQFEILTLLVEQLVVDTCFDYLALVDDHNLVRVLNRAQSMRDDKHSHVGMTQHLVDRLLHFELGLCIERTGGLIQQKHLAANIPNRPQTLVSRVEIAAMFCTV